MACWLAQTLPLNVCDAPKAQAGEVAPLSFDPFPSGDRRRQTSGVCAVRRVKNWRNKARMFMKTKEDDKQSQAGADIAFECLRCAEGAGG